MANFVLKMCFKSKYVIYSINKNILEENNQYTKTKFYYNIIDKKDKLFFQTRLKHNAKYCYQIKLDSYLIYYLRFIHWL